MRSSLRASRSRLLQGCILAMFASFAAGSAFAAAPKSDDVGKLLACRTIAAEDARLRCFDRAASVIARGTKATGAAVGPGTRAAASPARSPTAGASRAAAALSPRQTFGLLPKAILAREVAAGIRPKDIDSISARITGLQLAPDGRMIYRLDDGQTWEELQDNGYAPRVKVGDPVRISRGWLDSYWMQAPSGRGCKVQRLR